MTKDQRLARLLGRQDVLEDLDPLIREAGELAERLQRETPSTDDVGAFLMFMGHSAAEQAMMMHRITARVLELAEEGRDEVELARREGHSS